jgi:hypothetical protein
MNLHRLRRWPNLLSLLWGLSTCTVAAFVPFAAAASEPSIPAIETFGPLPNGRVGVVRNGVLHCLEMRRGNWRRCGDWQALALPSDTQRVLATQYVISLVRKGQIDFLEESADPGRGSSMLLDSGWSPWAMVNGLYTGDQGIMLFDEGRLLVRSPTNPDGNFDSSLECPEAQGRRLYGMLSPMHWALIGSQDVLAVKLVRDSSQGTLRCIREPSMDWVSEQRVDEVSVIDRSFLAARTVSTIEFWSYRQPPEGGKLRWIKGTPNAPKSIWRIALPELLLDQVLAGPTPELRAPQPLRRLDEGAMKALIDRVVPSRFVWAQNLDKRMLKVAQIPLGGRADEPLFGVLDVDGKEIISPSYTYLEHNNWTRRFLVTLGRGKAARSGFLDEQGRVVVPLVYERLDRISNVGSEPTVLAHQGGKMGYLNMVSGQIHVAPIYDKLLAISNLVNASGEGVLIAEKAGKQALVDTDGKELTAFEFEKFTWVRGGLLGKRSKDTMLFEMEDGRMVSTKPYVEPIRAIEPGQPFVGLGFNLKAGDDPSNVLIEGVIPGGPADKSKLQSGDLIIAVGDRKVFDMTFQEVVSAIRGEVNTMVKLQIQRGSKSWVLNVKRAVIIAQ